MHETRIANLKRPLRKSRIDEEFLANVWHGQKTSRTEVARGAIEHASVRSPARVVHFDGVELPWVPLASTLLQHERDETGLRLLGAFGWRRNVLRRTRVGSRGRRRGRSGRLRLGLCDARVVRGRLRRFRGGGFGLCSRRCLGRRIIGSRSGRLARASAQQQEAAHHPRKFHAVDYSKPRALSHFVTATTRTSPVWVWK